LSTASTSETVFALEKSIVAVAPLRSVRSTVPNDNRSRPAARKQHAVDRRNHIRAVDDRPNGGLIDPRSCAAMELLSALTATVPPPPVVSVSLSALLPAATTRQRSLPSPY